MEHVVIRRLEFVAGTREKPEVGVFVQSHKSHRPLNEEKISPNDIVWMKWVEGPLVAKSKILSYHSGEIKNSNINEARELTKGTKLFGLDKYWKSLAEKENCFYTVIRLRDEEWLE